MGIKSLISMVLLIGVLYSFHILAQDYQAITAPRLLKLIFKRDVSSINKHEPTVRWRKILQYDHIQCARYLYCDLGARPPDNEMRRRFIYMLTLNLTYFPVSPRAEILHTGSVSMTMHVYDKHVLMLLLGLAPDEGTPQRLTVGVWFERCFVRQNLNTKEMDKTALEVFKAAYFQGKLEDCGRKYPTCPFKISLLFDLLQYISLNKD